MGLGGVGGLARHRRADKGIMPLQKGEGRPRPLNDTHSSALTGNRAAMQAVLGTCACEELPPLIERQDGEW